MAESGVVGYGYWGKNLMRNFAEWGVLAAVVDQNPAVASAMAHEHDVDSRTWGEMLDTNSSISSCRYISSRPGGHPGHNDFDEVLSASGPPALASAAPAAQHYSLVRPALEADKHVFCEKPLVLKVEQAEELRDLALERGRSLMVGHLLHDHPAFQKLQELVADGSLGRVQYLYSNRLNLGKIRREEDILWSFAPHDISMILNLVGTEPYEVSAVGARYLHQSIADVTTTHLAFPGGERAHVFVSWLHPFKEQKLVVVGDRGMAVFDDGEPWETKIRLYRHHIDWHDGIPEPVRAESEPVPLEPAEPLRIECEHFLHCVSHGERPRTDGRRRRRGCRRRACGLLRA